MEKTKTSALNKLILVLSLVTFILSWVPKIEIFYRIMLLIAAIILLIIIYLSPYFKVADKIETKLGELENKIERIEDLIKIKNDITLLKKKCGIKDE